MELGHGAPRAAMRAERRGERDAGITFRSNTFRPLTTDHREKPRAALACGAFVQSAGALTHARILLRLTGVYVTYT